MADLNTAGTNINETGEAVVDVVPVDDELAAYDQLPPRIRAVLRSQPYNFSARTTLQDWRAIGAWVGEDQFIQTLKSVMAEQIARIRKGEA